MLASDVPDIRVRPANRAEVSGDGQYVLYWMIANRRLRWNFSLQRAVDWASELGKPLVVLEALRVGYPWASDRLHHFVIQGMADNYRQSRDARVVYLPYLEPEAGDGSGLLAHLADKAAVVVTDDFPCFFLPRMVAATAKRLPVLLEAVDSNGLLPLRATDRVFARAYDFRRYLQRELLPHLAESPLENPLDREELPGSALDAEKLLGRWQATDVVSLAEKPEQLEQFAIDHAVKVTSTDGGAEAAGKRLREFLGQGLERYDTDRNQPDEEVTSRLSPYLHFGHISAHEVFAATMERESWHPGKVADDAKGSSQGWWGTSKAAEGFLDELITWRELGYNMAAHTDDYTQYESLPDWAQETLAEHEGDEREFVYTLEEFERAETHDPLWNAAQRELVREGRIHNYLRMLWGKKILEWSASPRDALQTMIELNNKYALDGRDPNSYSGIFWVLGRYDRAWGPERPIFGKIRYMTSKNTAKKVRVTRYIEQYSAEAQQGLFGEE